MGNPSLWIRLYFAVHEVCKEALDHSGFAGLTRLLIEKQWQLATPDGKASFTPPQQKEPGVAWRSLTLLQLMHLLAERGESLRVDGRVFPFRLIRPSRSFPRSITAPAGFPAWS